jgi:23S rRNA (cytosine1962-C5)-methyltransferase
MNASIMNGPDQQKFRESTLVDFGSDATGRGRRLERLGGVLVDRPLPQATGPRRQPDTWAEATVVFTGDAEGRGVWQFHTPPPEPWQVELALGGQRICLEVRPAPSGQLGVFLEQWPQWQWLAQATPAGCRMLSLFGHSGAATLAVAAAGAEVVHVDASRQAGELARRNATASGLDQIAVSRAAVIRWIRDDARGFVAREVRRGSRYDGVILDPPSWGHGPDGEAFSIDRDLVPLLDDVARLLPPAGAADRGGPVLLTCHSPRWHHRRLHDTLADRLGLDAVEAGRLTCTDAAGRTLALGDFARHAPSRSHHHA